MRPDGMRALPIPVRDAGALKLLQGLFNLPDDAEGRHNFRLIAAWLVAALYPTGPYAVLAVDGEQGSGKSSACKMLRRLVDPNAADLRAKPRSEDDLLIAAMNGRVVALDNVSHIEADMADALCRLATGAGFGKRILYSDLGETIVAVSRPILLNGIPSLLARADLADRSIAVTLQHIPDDKRRPESEVWSNFDACAPAIFALLLDALVVALGRLPKLQLSPGCREWRTLPGWPVRRLLPSGGARTTCWPRWMPTARRRLKRSWGPTRLPKRSDRLPNEASRNGKARLPTYLRR